jgi:hypothetical protein
MLPEAPADNRQSPQSDGPKALLSTGIPASPRSARTRHDRPVTPEVAGSSRLLPLKSSPDAPHDEWANVRQYFGPAVRSDGDRATRTFRGSDGTELVHGQLDQLVGLESRPKPHHCSAPSGVIPPSSTSESSRSDGSGDAATGTNSKKLITAPTLIAARSPAAAASAPPIAVPSGKAPVPAVVRSPSLEPASGPARALGGRSSR